MSTPIVFKRDKCPIFGIFLEKTCKVAPEHVVAEHELYDFWCWWCGFEGGCDPGSKDDLRRMLEVEVPSIEKIYARVVPGIWEPHEDCYAYRGITLIMCTDEFKEFDEAMNALGC